jgi:hypothetical protein
LKEGIGLLFGRQDIAQLIKAKDRDFGIEIDQAIEVFRLGELGGKIKERDKDGLIAFEDGIVADGRGQMGFTDSGRTDEDKVRGFLEPVRMKKLHDLVPWDFGVEGPIKVLKQFNSFDPGGTHQVLDSLSLPELILLLEESLQQSRFFLGELVGISQQFKRLPEIREAHHNL